MADSDSGSRANAVKFRMPAPQSGRRSNSSGRASVTTRTGTPFDHSTRWAMKSRSPVSAHWRSSKSKIVVPFAAMRSMKMRQAANRRSRPPAGAGSSPSRVSRAGSTHRRSSGSGTYSTTVAAIRFRVVGSSSVAARPARRRTISPSAQKVIPSP